MASAAVFAFVSAAALAALGGERKGIVYGAD
jgi:hypothetical protein